MNNISIKELVEFRKKTDTSKRNFVSKLKTNKVEKKLEDSGGDYWISSLSAIANSFKLNDSQLIVNKRDVIIEKLDDTQFKKTLLMYERNIQILNNIENLNINNLRPKKINILTQQKGNAILHLKEFNIIVRPQYVFSFKNKEIEEFGPIWFIAKLGGFREDELGMFTEILYKYLKTHFSEKFNINPKYCIAVDVVNSFKINYSQLKSAEIEKLLMPTLNQIKKLL